MVGQTAGNAAHWIEHIAEHAADFRLWAGLAVEADADISAAAAWMEAASKGLAELGGSMVNHDYHHQHD
jgi:hypothetical protein